MLSPPRSLRDSSGARKVRRGGAVATVPSPYDLNPIPKLVEEYKTEGHLTVQAPDGQTTYYLYQKDTAPFLHVGWFRQDTPSTRDTRFGDRVCGWMNSGTWGTIVRPNNMGCVCDECLTEAGITDKEKRHLLGIPALEAVLGCIFSGYQMWRFVCGMGISNMGSYSEPPIAHSPTDWL